ncbi:MAG TPA: hypothetical protein PKD13_02170 [Mariniflexile sp.]|nr:hypothetical protein [Mariniflexile sp.]
MHAAFNESYVSEENFKELEQKIKQIQNDFKF